MPLHHPPRHCQRTACTRPGRAGVLTLKTPYRDGTTHLAMSPLEFMQRFPALVPRPRLHLIRCHGVLAPARLRPDIIPNVPVNANTPSADHGDASPPSASARLSWARLLNRVFDIDLQHCPPLRWPLQDHPRHRRLHRDCQDPHPSRLARPGTASIPGAAIRPTPNSLIRIR